MVVWRKRRTNNFFQEGLAKGSSCLIVGFGQCNRDRICEGMNSDVCRALVGMCGCPALPTISWGDHEFCAE